jgi:hypothetical protein
VSGRGVRFSPQSDCRGNVNDLVLSRLKPDSKMATNLWCLTSRFSELWRACRRLRFTMVVWTPITAGNSSTMPWLAGPSGKYRFHALLGPTIRPILSQKRGHFSLALGLPVRTQRWNCSCSTSSIGLTRIRFNLLPRRKARMAGGRTETGTGRAFTTNPGRPISGHRCRYAHAREVSGIR